MFTSSLGIDQKPFVRNDLINQLGGEAMFFRNGRVVAAKSFKQQIANDAINMLTHIGNTGILLASINTRGRYCTPVPEN